MARQQKTREEVIRETKGAAWVWVFIVLVFLITFLFVGENDVVTVWFFIIGAGPTIMVLKGLNDLYMPGSPLD